MPESIAFIFDMDGVITDSIEDHYRAWKQLADEEGIPFTREQNEDLRGLTRRESLLHLFQGHSLSEEQVQTLMARKNAYYQAYMGRITPSNLMPGVGSFLQQAKKAGIKLGIASSSRNAKELVTKLGVFDLFEAIGDGETVRNPKPAPDIFLWVAGRLNIRPIQCVVFEDSPVGIQAARSAGMFTVGLGNKSRVRQAHVILPSLEGCDLGSILQYHAITFR